MANLKHPHQLTSNYFNQECATYLLNAGYKGNTFFINSKQVITFTSLQTALKVMEDEIAFYTYHDAEEDQRSAGYSEYSRFKGISQLNTVGFMMLMHITNVVTLQQTAAMAATENY